MAALLSAEHLAQALGGSRAGSGWLCHCPAHDDQRPSLSIRQGEHGPVFNCFSGCDGRAVRDTLRGMGLMADFRPGAPGASPPRPQPAATAPSAEELRNRELAYRMWAYAEPWLSGTPAELYLQQRGVWEAVDHAENTVLRFARLRHPQTREENVACLVIPRHEIKSGSVIGCQRVFLAPDGSKYHGTHYSAPDGCTSPTDAKLSLGIAAGAWAMLQVAKARLLLAEGVESALAASILFERPAWARCGPFPRTINLPEHVREVLICADHDKNGNSQRKAERLAAFILDTGRHAAVWLPDVAGWDANDQLLARRAAA